VTPAIHAEAGVRGLGEGLSLARLAVPLGLAYLGVLFWSAGWAPAWLVDYPKAWFVPLQRWISDGMDWLMRDLDFGLFTFRELSRSVSSAIAEPMLWVKSLLAGGFTVDIGGDQPMKIPPLSWVSVVAFFTLLGAYVRSWIFGLLVGAAFLYMAVFGLWDSAMLTLASILVCVPVGVGIGLLLGIWSYRYRWVERALTPVFDVMQTMPSFAYLVPALVLFGYGPVAAVVVTMVYAMPPMARATTLGLRSVPAELRELSAMVGCTERQKLFKVLMPAARQTLMVGVNQVIMLSLNVVIIASVIGAGGLGFDVWQALQKLSIGRGLEAGLAITVMAIALDRLSQAWVGRGPHYARVHRGGLSERAFLLLAAVSVLLPTLFAFAMPAFATVPETLLVSTGQFWDELVKWLNVNLYETTEAVKTWTILTLIRPFKELLLALPWSGVTLVLAALGYRLGGLRLAAVVGGLCCFVAAVGLWDRSMVSLFLVLICVVLACAIGIPLGVWAAFNRRAGRTLLVIVDTVQTLPTFVYLIPVVMLFSVGDFAGMIVITIYAIAPAIRYTDLGLRLVKPELIEAARASGCTSWQVLRKVQMPIALPEILLGVNQTILMALSMVVIAALVGTRGLEQEILISLSKVNAGQGLTAGLCIAALAMVSDRLIVAWAARRRQAFGHKLTQGEVNG